MGSQIKGITKRGKDFFKLDTSHTEQISHLHVLGTNLWSAGAFTLNCYASANNAIADKYFYVCDDKINGMIVLHADILNTGQIMPFVVLACNDGTIKVIDDDGRPIYQVNLDAAPTCITLLEPSDLDVPQPTVILFGLQNGNIGAVELQQDEAMVLWEKESTDGDSNAPIQHLKVAQLRDKQPESCIVVRDDSSIEIYKFSPKPGQMAGLQPPALFFQVKETEAITGCVVGHVTSAARREILLSCYSGAIKSLVDKRQARRFGATTEDTQQMTEAQLKTEKDKKLTLL